MPSEKDLRSYFRKKLKIVQTLDEKWRDIAAVPPSRVPKAVSAAEDVVRELERLDRQYDEMFGPKGAAEAIRRMSEKDRASIEEDREKLRATLVRAMETLMHAKSRLEDLKKDLGRRLSVLRARPRTSRHGQFDRRA